MKSNQILLLIVVGVAVALIVNKLTGYQINVGAGIPAPNSPATTTPRTGVIVGGPSLVNTSPVFGSGTTRTRFVQ